MRLDSLDQSIISALQEDGTRSFRQLAKLCRSSEATIRRRVSRLKKSDVLRIVAVVNPFKQGYPVVAVINMKVNQAQMNRLKASLGKMKELRFVGLTLGEFDIVAEAWFQSTQEMFSFIRGVLAKLPGVLRIEPLQIHEMVTYAYDWGKSSNASPGSHHRTS